MDFSHVTQVLENSISSHHIPGAVAWIGRYDRVLFQFQGGYAAVHGSRGPMHSDTLFDLASLTKVVATLPAILLLVQQGALALETPVSHYFPEFREGMKAQICLSHLLTHSAGLMSHRPFYRWEHDAGRIIGRIVQEPLWYEPGSQVLYSDLGFILLGQIITLISGQSLGEFCESALFKPLGMNHTQFVPREPESMFAATEVVDGRALIGVVHDENARAMGGMAGHAGLFAPAPDLGRYLGMWVGQEGPLAAVTKDTALQLHTRGLNGKRGWGWVLRGDPYDTAGDLWPRSTASHTGFTGTSVVFDRPSGCWAILLTNRVHFGRQTNIGEVRRRFHNAAAGALFR